MPANENKGVAFDLGGVGGGNQRPAHRRNAHGRDFGAQGGGLLVQPLGEFPVVAALVGPERTVKGDDAVLPVSGEEITVYDLERVIEFQRVEALQRGGEELQGIRGQRAHEDPRGGEHQHLLVGGETLLHESGRLQQRIDTLVIGFLKEIGQMGIDGVHQVEDLGLVHRDADILRHIAPLEDFAEALHGLLGGFRIQGVAIGRGKDDDNAALRGELLVHLLTLAMVSAVGQELGDVLLVAHPRGEKREQRGQHDGQRNRQPPPFREEVVYPKEEVRHLKKTGRKSKLFMQTNTIGKNISCVQNF